MHLIFNGLLLFLCISYVASQGPIKMTTNNVKLEIMKKNNPIAPGITIRQSSNKKSAKACPQFVLTYTQVRKATYFMTRKIKPFTDQHNKCKSCIRCSTDCETPLVGGIVKSANQCVKQHSFGACLVAIYLIDVAEKISFPCKVYFKASRVGNCFVQEYLTLNGYKGKSNALIFEREVGVVEGNTGKKRFQCRAAKRAKLGYFRNQHFCRSKFRVTPRQMNAVYGCTSPAFTKASEDYSLCINYNLDVWATQQCYISFLHQINAAYIQCSFTHGKAAVIASSLSIGINPYNCPVLRRDSWIGRCRAPDFVQLKKMDLVKVKANSLQVLLPGACKY